MRDFACSWCVGIVRVGGVDGVGIGGVVGGGDGIGSSGGLLFLGFGRRVSIIGWSGNGNGHRSRNGVAVAGLGLTQGLEDLPPPLAGCRRDGCSQVRIRIGTAAFGAH